MIRSMTGFGSAAFAVDPVAFDVEIRSVNHRYLDLRVRLPRALGRFENELKTLVRSRLERGKVDLNVNGATGGDAPTEVRVDQAAADRYLAAAQELATRHGLPSAPDLTALLALPGVARFVEPDLPDAALRESLEAAVAAALDALDEMRVAEGASLAMDLATRLGHILDRVESIEGRGDGVQQAARDRLRKRSEQLRQETGLLDEARLHQEIVIAADRLDVSEELVRLRSHVEQFRSIVDAGAAGKPVGRRLDFLTQEMGREANTIGSKGSDAPIAHDVVELKTEIERIREQVQNIE